MVETLEGLDIEALLAPIEGEVSCGADLREDFSPQSPYYRLRDARADARAAERAQDADGETEAALPAEWKDVRELCVKALQTQTKDLELAAWLTESLVRTDGLKGLSVGAELLRGLVERYWENGLYPHEDEDGVATRVAPVTGLNGEGGDGTLIQPLRKIALFRRPEGNTLAYWQFEQAREVQGIADPARKKARLDAGVLPLDQLEQEARSAGGAHFAALLTATRAAIAAWHGMTDAFDKKVAADAPPTTRVRDLLEQIQSVIAAHAPAETTAADAPVAADEEALATGGVAAAAAVSAPAPVVETREGMLAELDRIAAFFRRTEPHSPLAYTLEEAARRGRLAWPDLLDEMVPDAAARSAILTSLGIKPPPPPAKK